MRDVSHPVRITNHYAKRMPQLVTRISDRLVDEIDGLIGQGLVSSRSEAVRLALERLVDQNRRRRIGEQIVDAYRRQPQTDEELSGIEGATRAFVAEDPW